MISGPENKIIAEFHFLKHVEEALVDIVKSPVRHHQNDVPGSGLACQVRDNVIRIREVFGRQPALG